MIAAQVLEQVVQGICGTEIGITPEADSCPADFFDQIENIDAFFSRITSPAYGQAYGCLLFQGLPVGGDTDLPW